MFADTIFAAVVAAVMFLVLSWPAVADSFIDDELSTEFVKHQAIDSAEVWSWKATGHRVGTVTVGSESTFSISNSEVRRIADHIALIFRSKYPQVTLLQINVTGDREGLEHTISFEGRITGPLVRGEVTCSDPRCNAEALINSPFTS